MSGPIMMEKPKRSSWKDRPFTWIIIGGVMLVLVIIALPDFLKYSGPPPTKQSEAKQNLKAIFTTQVAYFGDHDTFASGPDCFELLGWKPEGKTRYSYYCGESEIKCVRCERDCRYPNLSAISAEGFTVMAAGNVDKDDDCDVLTIDDAKNLLNIQNDVIKRP